MASVMVCSGKWKNESHQKEAEKEWQRILEQKINKGYQQRKTFQTVQLKLE